MNEVRRTEGCRTKKQRSKRLCPFLAAKLAFMTSLGPSLTCACALASWIGRRYWSPEDWSYVVCILSHANGPNVSSDLDIHSRGLYHFLLFARGEKKTRRHGPRMLGRDQRSKVVGKDAVLFTHRDPLISQSFFVILLYCAVALYLIAIRV